MVSRMFDQTCCCQPPTCCLFSNALDVCVGRAALPFADVALKRLANLDTVPPCEYELRDNGGMSHSSIVDRLRRERIPGVGEAFQPKGILQASFRRTRGRACSFAQRKVISDVCLSPEA